MKKEERKTHLERNNLNLTIKYKRVRCEQFEVK